MTNKWKIALVMWLQHECIHREYDESFAMIQKRFKGGKLRFAVLALDVIYAVEDYEELLD